MHVNVRGLNSAKITDLSLCLSILRDKVTILALNEHWLNNSSLFLLDTLKGFKVGDFYLRKIGRHGGSCILINETYKFNMRHDLKIFNEDMVFEGSFVEVLDFDLLVISIYTIPNYNIKHRFLDKLSKLFIHLRREKKNRSVIVAADFNIDLRTDYIFSNKFKEIVECNGFFINFSDATRISKNSLSCIDNILTNFKYPVTERLNLDLGLSDHNSLLINLPPKNKVSPISVDKVICKRLINDKKIRYFVNNISNDNMFVFDSGLDVNSN